MPMIRTAEAKDLPAVLSLAREFATSFVVDPDSFHRGFHDLLGSTSAYLIVAEEGAIIGYALAFMHPTFYANGPVAWVEELMVRADARGGGVGTLLMRSVESWARSSDCRLIGLATRRAASFYGTLGYEESAAYFRKLL